MKFHRCCIKHGSAHGYKQNLYQYLQLNSFAVEFQLTDSYRQLEQQLVEKYNPRYNSYRAYTGLGPRKGREAEYGKERYQKYKEEISEKKKQYYEANKEKALEQAKQYYESHKEQRKQYRETHREEILEQQKHYNNQQCLYNGQIINLNTLSMRFCRAGIQHPTLEAKKYLIRSSNDQ